MRNAGRFILVALVFLALDLAAAAAQTKIGGGIHYLRNLGDITADGSLDLSRNSVSLAASIEQDLGLLSIDAQVGYVFDHVGTGEPLWEPSVWGKIGGLIYGGAGIGIGYTDGNWQDDAFYALRAGVDLPLGGLDLDVYGSWRFQGSEDFEDLSGEDLDSIMLGALLRIAL